MASIAFTPTNVCVNVLLCFAFKEECPVEASKKVHNLAILVRLLTLAAMAEGYSSIPLELAETVTGPHNLPAGAGSR